MPAEQALEILAFTDAAVEGAIMRAQGLETELSIKAQELSKTLLESQDFLQWMLDLSSTSLFINGVIEDEEILGKEWAFTLATSTGRSALDLYCYS